MSLFFKEKSDIKDKLTKYDSTPLNILQLKLNDVIKVF